MTHLTRRGFLTNGSIGVALAGALAAVPGLATVLRLAPQAVAGTPPLNAEPLVAHIRDLASGEISLLVGTDQIIHHDRALAAQLYAAARPSR